MTKGHVPRPISNRNAGSLGEGARKRVSFLAIFLFLLAIGLPLIAEAANPPTVATGGDDFGQYLADHQAELTPFFSQNSGDFIRAGVPILMGLLGMVIVVTMLIGWVIDLLLSRGFAYLYAPAFAEWKRSVIYATGRLFLSFVYSGLLCLAIIFSLKFQYAGVIAACSVTVLLVVAFGAQLVWILYLYRSNFLISIAFYLGIMVAHTVVGGLLSRPLLGLRVSAAATEFVDQVITPRLQAEADAAKKELAGEESSRSSAKNKVADLKDQIAQAQTDAEQLRKEIEEKKSSDIYVFSRIVQLWARGDLAAARDQLSDFPAKFPSSSLLSLAKTQLAQINDQLAAKTAQTKAAEADTVRATDQARADLLARAAKGEVTLSEMRRAVIGKSRAEVSSLLGLPTDTASNTWNYRQQMIYNPLTSEKHGLTVYFTEGIVQGVDYAGDAP
jgi:hypothetical protein